MSRSWRIPSALLALALSAPAARAQDAGVPLFVPVQGRLLDGNDVPVNGAAKLSFAIYTVAENPQGGAPVAPLWSATYSPTLASGVYGLELGDISTGQPPLPAELFDGTAPRWLGVSVNGGTEMRPRLRIDSVPHALLAGRALKADDARRLGGQLPADFHDAAQLTGVAPAAVLGSGSSALTTVGTVTQGTWNAAPVADAFVASAATWNRKIDHVEHGASLSGDGAATPLGVVFGNSAGTAAQGNDPRFTQLDQKFAGYLPLSGGTVGGALGVAGAASFSSASVAGNLTVGGSATVTGSASVGGLTTTGDVSAGSLRGAMLSSNRSTAGLESDLLLNALAHYTVTQTGPAPLNLAALFDGNFQPSYSDVGQAPSASSPQVILVDGLPGLHTQGGAWVGWSTRYWGPKRWKLEIFDTYQNANAWRAIADYSNTDYQSGDYVGFVDNAVASKIRLTVYATNGQDGRLGLSELFFLHPEATTPYQALLPTTETFTAWLANAADFTTPAGTSATNMKYTTVQQNSNSSVFEMQPDGALKVKKPGFVRVHANADVIVDSGFNYATMELAVNGSLVTRTLAPNTGGSWAQLADTLEWKVNAGDLITIRSYPNQVRSMDNDSWSTLSVSWTGLP